MKKGMLVILFLLIGFLMICSYKVGQESMKYDNSDLPAPDPFVVQSLQSKCYTSLQPEKFFNYNNYSPISRITLNNYEDYITIDITKIDREFSIEQASSTGSMRPSIGDYSQLIAYTPENESDIHVGDIIVFECNGVNLAHRVIEIKNHTYITKGDNNNVDDVDSFGCQTTFDLINKKIVGILY